MTYDTLEDLVENSIDYSFILEFSLIFYKCNLYAPI